MKFYIYLLFILFSNKVLAQTVVIDFDSIPGIPESGSRSFDSLLIDDFIINVNCVFQCNQGVGFFLKV